MIAYYEDARHFAWLVNGWICQGEKEIDEAQIKAKNIRLTGKTGSGRTARMRSRYRDVFKEIGKVKIVLMIGTELQSFVDQKTIPEIENIEEDTYDVMWNFLDKRMLELKENVQNEDGGINMCGAVDQMIAEGMERGLEQGMERGLKQGMERVAQEKVWGIRNMIEVCQELGGTYDNTQFQVEMRCHLSQEDAGKYMKQYWK